MNSERIKSEIVRSICLKLADKINTEDLRIMSNYIFALLYKYTITEETTALSTEVRKPNEFFIKQFIAIKRVKGLQPKSIKFYLSTINNFLAHIPKSLADVTTNDIRFYLGTRESENVSKATLENERRNLSSFFATLSSEKLIDFDPCRRVERIKQPKVIKKPFSEMEMEQLRLVTKRTRQAKKNLAIVEFLYSTGCRVSELVNTKIADIKGDSIKVVGKGNKERIVYLNPRALVALSEYLNQRKDNNEYIFPKTEGCFKHLEVLSEGHMEMSSVESMVRHLGKKAGIENVHPHRFRRTAATIALRRGMPIDQVQKMLGHEQITTTQIYAITDDEQIKVSHQKYLT